MLKLWRKKWFDYFSKIYKSQFSLNFIKLMGGSIIGQALTVIVAPILSRLFKPDDFGVYAIYISILTIVGSVSSFQYSNAIVLPEEDKDAINLIILSEIIVIAMSLLICLPIGIFRNEICKQLNSPALENWLWLIPLGIFLLGTYEILNYWAIRKKEFSLIAGAGVIQTSMQNGVSIISGIQINPGVGGLISGQIIGQISSNYLFFKRFLATGGYLKPTKISYYNLEFLMHRYIKFPKFQMGATLINQLAAQAPAILIAHFFTPHIVGLYFLAHKLLGIPIGNISNVMAKIFLQRAAEEKKLRGSFTSTFLKTSISLLALGIIPFSAIVLFGPSIFQFIFGKEWFSAGVYAQILSPLYLIMFVVSPLTTSLIISEKQEINLLLQIFYLILTSGAFLIGGGIGSIKVAMLLYVIAGFIRYLIELIICFKVSGTRWNF